MKPAGWAFKALLFAAVISGITALNSSRVSAADGSGTNVVSPVEVAQFSEGNTLTFTFTAAEVMDSGGIRISIPSGWSAPQGVLGVAGYTTASSTGVVGSVKNNLDSSSGWAFTRHMSLSVDAGDKQEGLASLSNTISASAVANEEWYFNYGATTSWGSSVSGANLRVGLWLKPNVGIASGDFFWVNDDSVNLASPLDLVAIPSLSGNAWNYVSVTLGSSSRTSISSYGLRYANDIGAVIIKADAFSVIFNSNDSNSNWTGDSGISDTLITGAGNFMEGTGAVRCTYAESAGVGTSGDCYFSGSLTVIGPGTTIGFWVRPSVALNAGDFAWVDDNDRNINSADSIINLPALPAGTWTYVAVISPTSDNLRSFGLRQLVDKGAMTIDIDGIGKIFDTADSTTGWTAPTADVQAVSTDTSIFQEGTASLKNVIAASASSGDKWYESLPAAEDWSGYTTVGFWIRSTVATSGGDLKFEYASSTNLSSPIASLNISSLSANTWTFQKLTLTGTRTSVRSYGVNYATDIGAATVYLDDILLGPGTPTFSGNDINVRVIFLPSSGTISVLYGDGGGTSGVTASGTTGVYAFTTKSRSSDSGVLTNIASSPSVEVVSASAVKFVIDDPTDGTVDAPITVTVRALRSNNSLATNYQSDVTLLTSGSATGGGLVDIVNGVGTIQISNTVAETITLTLSDTEGTGLDVSSTQDVVFAPGATASLALNDPGDIAAGERATYAVTKKDQFGNTTPSGSVTVYLYSTSTGGNKAFYDASTGGAQITSVIIGSGSSSANFWYYDELVGTWTITASDNATAPDGLAGVDDAIDSITVSASATAAFFLNDPGDIAAGSRAAYVVTRKDAFNNLVSSGSNVVHLYSTSTGPSAFYDASSGGSVITSITISGGSSSANFWYYDEAAGTWTITASDNSSAPDGTAGVDDATDLITVSVTATRFTIVEPTDTTVDSSATITIRAENNNGALDVSYQSDVTLLTSGSATGGGLVDIVNGVGTIQISNTVAETVTLTLSDTESAGLDVTSTKDIVFAPGATASFTLNDPGDMTAGARTGYIVTKKDQFGNTTPSGSVTAYFYSASTGTHAFYDAAMGGNIITSLTIGSGSSSANFWYYDEKAGDWMITASDNSSAPDGTAGVDDATDSIIVSPAAVSKFTLNDPGDITAGDRAGYVVTRTDAFGNSVTAGPQTVYLYSSSTGGNKAFYDASAGGNIITSVMISGGSSSANFWYYDELVGTWTITASDNATAPDGLAGIDDATDSLTVNHAATSAFFLNDPGDISAGTRAAYVISRRDAFNNLVTSGSVTVYLYSTSTGGNKAFYDASTGGAQITSVIIGSGSSSANFWYYDELVGTWSVIASDNPSAPDGIAGINDATDTLSVSPAETGKFLLNDPGDMSSGTRLGYTVSREDDFGNSTFSGSDVVHLYSNSTGSFSFYDSVSSGSVITSVMISNGSSSANFWYYDEAEGTWTITVSDNATAPDGAAGIDDATDSVTVTATAIVATRFTILEPTGAAVGSSVTVTVRAEDDLGNVDTTYQSDVTLLTSGSATGGGLVDIVNGVGTIQISNTVAETIALTLSDTEGTGLDVSSARNITFSTGATAALFLNDPGSIAAGDRVAYIAQRKDQFGNAVTSGSETFYLYSTSTGPHAFYDSASGGSEITSIVFLSGSSSVGFWYADEKVGDWIITVSDNSSSPDGAAGVNDAEDIVQITAGPASRFSLNDPGDMTVATRLGYTVSREDAFGNPITSGATTVYLYSDSSGPKAFYDSAVNGSVITSIVIGSGSFSVNFWYYDESTGIKTVIVSDNASAPDGLSGIDDATDSVVVTSAAIIATRFTIIQPQSALVGSSVTVTVRAEDDLGNVDTTYQSDVTLLTSGSATGGGLVDIVNGVGTIQISNTVAETVTLTLSDTEGTGLDVSSARNLVFSAVALPSLQIIIPSPPPARASIRFSGQSFPEAKIVVASTGNGSPLRQERTALRNGSFDVTISGFAPGSRSFSIVAYDPYGAASQRRVFNVNIGEGETRDISGVYFPPTIKLSRSAVTRGDSLLVSGYAIPGGTIEPFIDGEFFREAYAIADQTGHYQLLIGTISLEFGSHSLTVRETGVGTASPLVSATKTFSVSRLFTPKTDLNRDDKIDISDWSIFISKWGALDDPTRTEDLDFNGDGKVDIADFSIFVRTIKR